MTESQALTVPQRVAGLLKSVEREAALKELAEKSITITTITNPAGYQQCHAARMVLKNQRIIIEKDGKAARDEANKFREAVIAEEKRLIALIDPEETRLKGIQDGYDAEQERIKQAKAEAERQRIAGIQARIARIANSPVGATGKDAAQIQAQLNAVQAIAIDASFAEFQGEATDAKTTAVVTLTEMHTERVAFEEAQVRAEAERQQRAQEEAEERERVAAERAELARLRAEQEAREEVERKRLEQERLQQEAAAKAERERIAAEEAAARERIEAEQREADRIRQEADDKARREREAAAAELKRQQDELAAQQEAARVKAQKDLTAKKQKQKAEITELVAGHLKISAEKTVALLKELYA